jgi:hypothetical protein
MTKHRGLSVALLLMAVGTAGAMGQDRVASWTQLCYTNQTSIHTRSALVKSPTGTTYRISLVPDFDVARHVVVLELVLRRPGGGNGNLFDPTGRLHGYQQYDFAASDFIHGPDQSIYGDTRTINLPQLRMAIQVRVEVVKVEPTSQQSVESMPYEFDTLVLQVRTEGPVGKEAGGSMR